jgi:predicted GTPase
VLISDGRSFVRVRANNEKGKKIVSCTHSMEFVKRGIPYVFEKITRKKAVEISGEMVKLPFEMLVKQSAE